MQTDVAGVRDWWSIEPELSLEPDVFEVDAWTVREPQESEQAAEFRRLLDVQQQLAEVMVDAARARELGVYRIYLHEVGGGVRVREYILDRGAGDTVPRAAGTAGYVAPACYRVDLTECEILAVSAALDCLEAVRRPDDPENLRGVASGLEMDGHALSAARGADLSAVRAAQDTFLALREAAFYSAGPNGVLRRIAR